MPLANATMVQVVDAIVADLEAQAGLPTHSTQKYIKSHALRADLGPWLSVFPDHLLANIETTVSDHLKEHRFVVMWSLPEFVAAESNTYSAADCQAALAAADSIQVRLESYGGAIGSLNISGELEEAEFGEASGMFWQAKYTLKVQMFS